MTLDFSVLIERTVTWLATARGMSQGITGDVWAIRRRVIVCIKCELSHLHDQFEAPLKHANMV